MLEKYFLAPILVLSLNYYKKKIAAIYCSDVHRTRRQLVSVNVYLQQGEEPDSPDGTFPSKT